MRWVRRAFLVSLIIFSASCRADQPIDCIAANREIFDCFDADPSALREGRYDQCIPHSQSLTISGVWVSDFEWNQFHEDSGEPSRGTKLQDFKRFIEVLPELAITDDEMDVGDGAVIGRITFVGRRPLCRPYLGSSWIMVDRVLSWDVLETGQSGSITYGADGN